MVNFVNSLHNFFLTGSVNYYPAGSEGASDHHRGELGVDGVPGPGQGAPQAGGHGGGDQQGGGGGVQLRLGIWNGVWIRVPGRNILHLRLFIGVLLLLL
jgi:hypothetical protein